MGAPGRLLGLRRAAARLAAGVPEAAPEDLDLERLLRSRAKAARERRIQRLMEPPRPPERTLTRQAMEQLRYLGREWPEEWPVSRLARGFQVSPAVVARVLRSRFAPSEQRAARQDARAHAHAHAPAGRLPRGPQAAPSQEEEEEGQPRPSLRAPAGQRGPREVFGRDGSLLYRVPGGSPLPDAHPAGGSHEGRRD